MRALARLLPALAIGLALAWPALAGDRSPGSASSARECAVCHVRWVTSFFSGGSQSDFMSRPGSDAVQSEEMCFSCHDGSVQDSRVRLLKGARHQVKKPPPPGMVVPPEFPLDADGNVTCGTCHTAHGVSLEEAKQGDTFFLRASNRGSAMCVRCHTEQSAEAKGNHPYLPTPAAEGAHAVTCEDCHDVHGATEKPMLARGAGDSSLCLQCHEDRGNDGVHGLAGGGHPVGVVPVTASPSSALLALGARLGPGGQVTCLSCHGMHGRARTDSLLLETSAGSKLCVSCHSDRPELVGSGHDLALSAPQVRNGRGETPATGGVCSSCHLAHGSARRVASAGPRATAVCRSCHARGGPAHVDRMDGYGHPLDVSQDGEPVTCASCHDPHRPAAVGATGAFATAFLRAAPTTLCTTCHEGEAGVVGGRHDMTALEGAQANVDGRAPGDSGPCLACHEVHGTLGNQRFARLLAKEGGDEVERLCRTCHASDREAGDALLTGASHPVGVAPAASGVQTKLPLVKPRGKSAKAAVMTCATCHDPHRWSPDGTPERAPFASGDGATSFLRVPSAPDSTLCTECHTRQAYVEGTDHDMQVSAPKATNIDGVTTKKAGTCSACHVPHGAQEAAALWARQIVPTEGVGRAGEECLSCHSGGRPASRKVPDALTHPDVTIPDPSRIGKGPAFPVFDPETGRRQNAGAMSCPSCHQAHQWNVRAAEAGHGEPAEGDALTSFLRSRSLALPCKDCHGRDALYLYQHFHDERARRSPEAQTASVEALEP